MPEPHSVVTGTREEGPGRYGALHRPYHVHAPDAGRMVQGGMGFANLQIKIC